MFPSLQCLLSEVAPVSYHNLNCFCAKDWSLKKQERSVRPQFQVTRDLTLCWIHIYLKCRCSLSLNPMCFFRLSLSIKCYCHWKYCGPWKSLMIACLESKLSSGARNINFWYIWLVPVIYHWIYINMSCLSKIFCCLTRKCVFSSMILKIKHTLWSEFILAKQLNVPQLLNGLCTLLQQKETKFDFKILPFLKHSQLACSLPCWAPSQMALNTL